MKSVLTISQSKEIARLIHSALRSDYHMDTANCIKDGLKLHHQRQCDLVLSDLDLLRDGLSANNYNDVIRPFKQVNPQVKIVVLSTKDRIRETVKTVKTAADDYLTYPLHPAKSGWSLNL